MQYTNDILGYEISQVVQGRVGRWQSSEL